MVRRALSDQEQTQVRELAEAVAEELAKRELFSFRAMPTVYVNIIKETLCLILTDEGNSEIDVIMTTTKKKGVIGFFITRFILEDFFGLDSGYINSFAEEKVDDYEQDTLEMNAYSKNLQRAENLVKDGHYYAALVILISAFEVASRDIFLRHNDLWFVTIHGRSRELYERLGVRLSTKDENREYKVRVHWGDDVYGFDQSNHSILRRWESVRRGDEILKICRQLRIRDEYLQNLYGNSYQEIGFYEILKEVLQKSQRRPINFQMLDGTGGVKWCYKRFFSIDLEVLSNEIRVLRESLQKRHQIIHGDLDDSQITEREISELENAVRMIINYIKDNILTWEYVLP